MLYMFQAVFRPTSRAQKLYIHSIGYMSSLLAKAWHIPDAVCVQFLSSWWWAENRLKHVKDSNKYYCITLHLVGYTLKIKKCPTIIPRYLMGLCSCKAPSMYRIAVYGRLRHNEWRKRDASAQIRRHLFVDNAPSRKVITLDIKLEKKPVTEGRIERVILALIRISLQLVFK